MNIRKALLLTLVVAIAALGLTLAGCEQKAEPPKVDHPSGEHPTADACCSDDPSKCCASKAVDEAKEAVKTCCGDDPSKCCASKAVDEAKEAVKTCCGDDPSKCCASKAAEHPEGEHPH
ncbi:MAG: hypothetical protein ACYSOF_01205 [Planctomycetota bacterium]|jgi:hypothetical protein